MDRRWMYERIDERGLISHVFVNGVNTFLTFAQSQTAYLNGIQVRCPCRQCDNLGFEDPDVVKLHLYKFGFTPDYEKWINHGETMVGRSRGWYGDVYQDPFMRNEPMSPLRQMVFDVAGPSFAPERPVQEEPNLEAKAFYDMLRALDEPLYPGSKSSMMSTISQLMTFKSDNQVSESGYDTLLKIFGNSLPEGHKMVDNFYETKKLMKGLGLPVVKIDCCRRGCMLFWKENIGLSSCKVCNLDRYKNKPSQRGSIRSRHDPSTSAESGTQKLIPYKRIFYFPLKPRLKRLYYSRATAADMTWHHDHVCDEGSMCHPCDSEAWKHFNDRHPEFSSEPRNVRLGLCTDGFQPFGQSGQQYSCWPIIVTPYNLPPWMCLKEATMFLTTLVPGPSNPKQKIDVYLQPLIDELNELWTDGVDAYDVSRKQNFTLKAALMWTISDFPAYSMLSGWGTSGKLACPHCMEDTDAFQLEHGHKTSWFDNHRKFLPHYHPFRTNKKKFRRNHVVRRDPPPSLTGEEVYSQIEEIGLLKVTEENAERINARIVKDTGCGWRKKSIFWDLPYWRTNLIRHNLDVMHIEKNVFDNVFNTVMDVKGKTKDNAKSRKDCENICRRPELKQNSSSGQYPKACYTLDTDERKILLKWVRGLKFPDGYVSNLARCIDEKKLRLFGMKSHDCHVFMQRLLPVAFRQFLPRNVWEALTELSLFFKNLCANVLSVEGMEKLEEVIPVLLCKLEMIFPPSFFDSMEHLMVHLPYEARVGGPVQYRWMYPFERFLGTLKKKVKNKARVEGSICNAYLVEEIANFSSFYFQSDVTMDAEVSLGEMESNNGLEAFSVQGRPYGITCIKSRYMSSKEYASIHTYILMNSPEVEPFLEIFKAQIRENQQHCTDSEMDTMIYSQFHTWFHDYGRDFVISDERVRNLSMGPSRLVKSYPVYFVNGYRFHTRRYGTFRSAANNCISVVGETMDFYGTIIEILEVEYPGSLSQKIVMFNCEWYDPTPIVGTNIHDMYKLVEVNVKKKYKKYEPFIFASQAIQVYFASYPSKQHDKDDWVVAFPVKARGVYELPENQVLLAYQEKVDEVLPLSVPNDNDQHTLVDAQIMVDFSDESNDEPLNHPGDNEYENVYDSGDENVYDSGDENVYDSGDQNYDD